jgi:hypothetical protein
MYLHDQVQIIKSAKFVVLHHFMDYLMCFHALIFYYSNNLINN